ncbi:DUF397 domain-containing protein [Streptomyces mirabilis]|uniref:DUF397 domain-containing protein n=1 Tax=Streptomyces mirabilis TaxID=68239 RepID=UPI00224D5EBA|nr:DUF397 domain-containing protein [Streptomyces mirabilis]MCX4427201.1 DUF397 domain-containing protein [Streptomyces mirabilis]
MSNSTELAWFKSSCSGTEGDNCIEVAATERAVHVRDSKDVERPHVTIGGAGWVQFVRYVAGS